MKETEIWFTFSEHGAILWKRGLWECMGGAGRGYGRWRWIGSNKDSEGISGGWVGVERDFKWVSSYFSRWSRVWLTNYIHVSIMISFIRAHFRGAQSLTWQGFFFHFPTSFSLWTRADACQVSARVREHWHSGEKSLDCRIKISAGQETERLNGDYILYECIHSMSALMAVLCRDSCSCCAFNDPLA